MVESSVIISNILSNGVFIATIAFFVKRWMDKVDKNADQIAIDRKADAKQLADDLKISVANHQEELRTTADKLESHLDRIYEQLRTANGRTAKIEGGLETVKEVCAERHGNGHKP